MHYQYHERLRRSAVMYASMGMHVFPIQAGGKIPYGGSHGELDGTSNPAEVDVLWRELPGSNIAWALRFDPGAFVLDVDARNGGCDWMSERPPMPPTVTVLTPSKGGSQHYWLGMTTALSTVRATNLRDAHVSEMGGLEDVVDLKGLPLGYVLLPPSRTTKGGYYFEAGLSPLEQDLAPCPTWLEAEILVHSGRKRPSRVTAPHADAQDAQSFYLGRLFAELGALGEQVRPGVWVVQCPNAAQHTGAPRRFAGDSTIHAPPVGSRSKRGAFYCAHAHCEGVGRDL